MFDVAYTVEMILDKQFTASLFLPIMNITILNYRVHMQFLFPRIEQWDTHACTYI